MQLEIVKNAKGDVIAAAEVARDGDVAAEAVLEEGATTEIVDVRHSELLDDLDGTLKQLGRKGKG